MSEEQQGSDTPNRATVALVAEMVKGLRELTTVEFDNIKQRLEPLSALPVAFAELRRDHDAIVRRVADLESQSEKDEDRRRIHLPTLVVAILFMLIALAGLIVQLSQLH